MGGFWGGVIIWVGGGWRHDSGWWKLIFFVRVSSDSWVVMERG